MGLDIELVARKCNSEHEIPVGYWRNHYALEQELKLIMNDEYKTAEVPYELSYEEANKLYMHLYCNTFDDVKRHRNYWQSSWWHSFWYTYKILFRLERVIRHWKRYAGVTLYVCY